MLDMLCFAVRLDFALLNGPIELALRLADGQQWVIPVCHVALRETAGLMRPASPLRHPGLRDAEEGAPRARPGGRHDQIIDMACAALEEQHGLARATAILAAIEASADPFGRARRSRERRLALLAAALLDESRRVPRRVERVGWGRYRLTPAAAA